jgi:hypothetical protein
MSFEQKINDLSLRPFIEDFDELCPELKIDLNQYFNKVSPRFFLGIYLMNEANDTLFKKILMKKLVNERLCSIMITYFKRWMEQHDLISYNIV